MRALSSSSGCGYGKTRSSWISPRKSDFANDETSRSSRAGFSVVAVSIGASDLLRRAGSRADVRGGRADQPALALLLEDVRRPTGHAGAREHRREEVGRNARVVEHHGRPEFHVRGQHALRMALL